METNTIKANQSRFLFKTSTGNFSVIEFSGEEKISEPYHFKIFLKASDSSIEPGDIVKKRARLTYITQTNKERHINGVVGKASIEKVETNFAIYSVDIYPLFWLLSFRKQSRIFQKMTAPDVIKEVLQDAGISTSEFKISLSGNYTQREYCVQYQENDLNFIKRLCTEEGIFFFFKQETDREIIFITDDASGHPKSIPEFQVKYHPDTGAKRNEEETVLTCSKDVSVYSGKVVLNDYNYEQPGMQLRFMSASKDNQELELYNHPGGYKEASPGENRVQIYKDSAAVKSNTIKGKATFRCLSAGHKFKMSNHPNDSFNALFIPINVKHNGKQTTVFPHGEAGKDGIIYECTFDSIPAEKPYRPEKILPKPLASVQTAIVIGPEGDQVYMDESGRVKVKFHWDRICEGNDCSCWIRVSDGYAGADHGSHFPPLIGDEVIVDFLHGDPDRPIITGRVYNGNNIPPVKPEEMVRNITYTPYGHTFLLDDKNANVSLNTGGGEQILMTDNWKEDGNMISITTADGHTLTAAEGNNLKGIKVISKEGHQVLMEDAPSPGITISDKNEELSINLDSKSQTITISNNTSKSINIECTGGSVSINAKKVDISGSSGVDIESSSHISLSAPDIKINGSNKVEIEAGMDISAKAGKNFTADGGMNANIKAGTNAKIEGAMTAALKGGMSAKIEGGAMTDIKGGLVKIN